MITFLWAVKSSFVIYQTKRNDRPLDGHPHFLLVSDSYFSVEEVIQQLVKIFIASLYF